MSPFASRLLALISIVLMLLVLLFAPSPASATQAPPWGWWKPPVYSPPVTRTVAAAPKPGSSGSSNWYLCPTPIGWFVCGVAATIVIVKVKRVIEGPPCATGKMIPGLFGPVVDAPEIWLKACNWQDPPIAVRG